MSLIIGMTVLGFSSATAKADPNPVDLELGGAGATPWNITDIQPSDSGTRTVELRNTGSRDGFVTIWVSDIVSNEGENPESETGDTAEPGEFADHLLLNLVSDNISTNVDLPATIHNLPQSAAGLEYIDIIPLKVGNTVNLQWEWELPSQAGNEIQGDDISFTIEYLLRECTIIDVSSIVDPKGKFKEAATIQSTGGKGKAVINKDTTGKTKEDQPLTEIWIVEIDREPPAAPEDTKIVGLNFNIGPDGTTFDQPITITLSYNPGDIPQGVDESDLVIALWDEDADEWVPLTGCTVNRDDNTISASITHFSRYTIISPLFPPPSSPHPEPDEKSPTPTEDEEDAPETTNILEINMLDQKSSVETGANGTLSQPLTLTDRNGNFIININKGTKVIGPDGEILSLIELSIIDEQITVPEGVVILSPVYRLTGYNHDMQDVGIVFFPPVRLTIRYDPDNLPEYAFMPFIANYTSEQGLVELPSFSDCPVEIGKVKALVSHASLFAAAVRVAPPPLPLPAKFKAGNLIIAPRQVYLGETVTIGITITNEGATPGSYELHLIIDGIVQAIEEVTLDAGSSETLTFEVSNLAVGNHQIKIAGLTEQLMVVRMTATLDESEFNWPLLDASVAMTLVMASLALYIIMRRARQTNII